MGITCKMHFDANNNIDYIEAPNGERSKLFDSLRDLAGEEALTYMLSLKVQISKML